METIQQRALIFVYKDNESTYDFLLKKETMICMLCTSHLRRIVTEVF